jgi:DNA (cytosine-5)-methyltransferase 1
LCAGGGGQAIGLENAGFRHVALVENDKSACETLKNRPWKVLPISIVEYDPHERADLVSAGIPCPPFSVAGRQLGSNDERDLFPRVLDLVEHIKPRAVLIENVPGLMQRRFADYRRYVSVRLDRLGYDSKWIRVDAADFGVPQSRRRTLLIALREPLLAQALDLSAFHKPAPTVGEALFDEMASRGWARAKEWAAQANGLAPTIVGGSKKHGGPDLGPSRSKQQWKQLGVEPNKIAEQPPPQDWDDSPQLTVRMAAILQGFDPDKWPFQGTKTQKYRQVGNALPPPVAEAAGRAIREALLVPGEANVGQLRLATNAS